MAEVAERTAALIAWRPDAATQFGAALSGMRRELPAVGRFTEADGLVLARAAPFQLLAMRAGVDAALLEELAPLTGIAGVIDQSDARVGVRLSGRGTAGRLAYLLPIDLHPDHFGPGHCAQTVMAHLSVLVLQHAADDYELLCGRSFAGSFLRAIDGVAAEPGARLWSRVGGSGA